MTLEALRPSQDPAAWTAAALADAQRWTIEPESSAVAELDAALDAAAARGLGVGTASAADFAMPRVDAMLRGVLAELRDGRGFVLLRGLPFGDADVGRARLATWAIGTRLGRAVNQTVAGTLLADVVDRSGGRDAPRQFQTAQELRLHTDPASDLVGLACVRPAADGGVSVLASAATVHDAMLDTRPDLLALLYAGFRWHRFGEGRPQDGPVTDAPVPVLSRAGARVACRYVRVAIAAGHDAIGVPLTDPQVDALDLFDRLAADPAHRVAFALRAGDLLLVNNLVVLHARTRFIDPAGSAAPRHLLRLWLAGPPGFCDVDPRLNYFDGGACGIPLAPGRAPDYDPAAIRGSRAAGPAADLGLSGRGR